MRAVVVGAGVSGAFAADALRTRFGQELDVHVLERDTRIGGRAHRRALAGVEVEAGASLFHSSNRLLSQSCAALGLGLVRADTAGTMGIWDGSRIVFQTSGRRGRDTLLLLSRYRLPLLRAGRDVKQLIRRLEQVYPRLERGDSWDGPQQLLGELGLYPLSQRAAADHFASGRFTTEFLDGVSRNNYAQVRDELNALVELVSLAGAGLGGGSLLHVAQGNAAIPAGLLTRAAAGVRTGATVHRIERERSTWRVSGAGFGTLVADIVILAGPLEHSGIELPSVPAPPHRDLVVVHVTIIRGTLCANAIGGARPVPGFVLSTAAAGSVLSVERLADTDTGAIYKVFSTELLADPVLDRFFEASEVIRTVWDAYPRLAPTAAWPDFRLGPGLYYTGAMEYAVSTMETQAIAGVASANLAAKESNGPGVARHR